MRWIESQPWQPDAHCGVQLLAALWLYQRRFSWELLDRQDWEYIILVVLHPEALTSTARNVEGCYCT